MSYNINERDLDTFLTLPLSHSQTHSFTFLINRRTGLSAIRICLLALASHRVSVYIKSNCGRPPYLKQAVRQFNFRVKM